MVNEVTLQPGYARESAVKIYNKQFYPSRYVYNSSIDVLGLNSGNSGYLTVILVNLLLPGRTFADVVK